MNESNLSYFGKPGVPNKDLVELKPGIRVSKSIDIPEATSGRLEGLNFSYRVEFNKKLMGYVISEVTIRNKRGYIRSDDLTKASIEELLHMAISQLPTDQLKQIGLAEKSFYLQLKKEASAELLKHVALIAAVARLGQRGENRAVMYAFDVSQATATRWIKKAMDEDLLDRISND